MSLVSFFFQPKAIDHDSIQILDVKSFKDAIKNKSVQLVDVRTANEFKNGHIENSLNIDFFKIPSFQNSVEKLNKEEPVCVYCRSGNRSQKAAVRLTNMGLLKLSTLRVLMPLGAGVKPS